MLTETRRQQLDGIVQKMTANKEPDSNISLVVNDFKQKYANEGGAQAPATAPAQPVPNGTEGTPAIPAPQGKGIFSSIGRGAVALGNGLISSERRFGKSIADALPAFVPGSAANTNKQNEEIAKQQHDIMEGLIAKRKELIANGGDTSHIDNGIKMLAEQMGKPAIDINETNASVNKTGLQIAGEGLGVFADIASAGSYGKAASGAGFLDKGFKLTKAVPIVENVAAKAAMGTGEAIFKGAVKGAKAGAKTGAIFGAAQGGTHAMQDNKSAGEIAADTAIGGGAGLVVGGGLGAVGGGIGGYFDKQRALRETLQKTAPGYSIASDPAKLAEFQKQIQNNEGYTMAVNAVKDDPEMASQIFQNGKVSKLSPLTPEYAAGRIDDTAANIEKNFGKDVADHFRGMIDPKNVSEQDIADTVNGLVENAKNVPTDLIRYNIKGGKKVVDSTADEALNAGLDPNDVALIKNAPEGNKPTLTRMYNIAKNGAADGSNGQQPVEEAGKTIISQAKALTRAKSNIGAQLGALRKSSTFDKPVDISKSVEDFVNNISDSGVNVDPEGKLDFSGSQYANLPTVQKAIQGAYDKVAGLDSTNVPARTVDLVKRQLESELGIASGDNTLDANTSRILKGLYRNLGDNITTVDPRYADLSSRYSQISGAQEDLQSLLGKDFSMNDVNSSLRAGETGRRILGNASAKVQRTLGNIQSLAQEHAGYDPTVDTYGQFKFAAFLQKLFGNQQDFNLEGSMTRANEAVAKTADVAGNVAQGNIGGAIMKTLGAIKDTVQDISPERQRQAIEALLTGKPSVDPTATQEVVQALSKLPGAKTAAKAVGATVEGFGKGISNKVFQRTVTGQVGKEVSK